MEQAFDTMSLTDYLRRNFPTGLPYDDAAQLCLHLYCVASDVPEHLQERLSRQSLADTFAELVRSGWVSDQESPLRAFYGAHLHDVADRGHWIEVIASIFKKGNVRDIARGNHIAQHLQGQCRCDDAG